MKYKLRTNLNNTDWLPNVEDTYPQGLLNLIEQQICNEDDFISCINQNDYSLIGLHCARLTMLEIMDIRENGISVGGKDLLYKKISNLPDNCNNIKPALIKHIQKLTETQADNLFYFAYGFLDLENDSAGYKNFLNNWGGESIYNFYDNPQTQTDPLLKQIKKQLSEVSIPCILIIRYPLKLLTNAQLYTLYTSITNPDIEINNVFHSICVTDYLPEVVDIIDMNKYSGLNFS